MEDMHEERQKPQKKDCRAQDRRENRASKSSKDENEMRTKLFYFLYNYIYKMCGMFQVSLDIGCYTHLAMMLALHQPGSGLLVCPV